MPDAPSSPPSNVNRKQKLRVFFSADLCGGDDFKHRWPAEDFDPRQAWPRKFENYFREFERRFLSRVHSLRASDDAAFAENPPRLWRMDDDALVWSDMVRPSKKARHVVLGSAVQAFVETVTQMDAEYLGEHGLGVRGAIWTAGFPLRNREIELREGNPVFVEEDAGSDEEQAKPGKRDPARSDSKSPKRVLVGSDGRDLDFGGGRDPGVRITNFIGRDMDLGRRLAETVPPGRVMCSLDLAQFVLEIPRRRTPRVFVWHVGWRRFPGVFGNTPYPMLLATPDEEPTGRQAWELYEPDVESTTPEVRRLLSGELHPLTKQEFEELAEKVRSTDRHMVRPYASDRDMPAGHRSKYIRDRLTMERVADIEEEAAAEQHGVKHSVELGAVPSITTDELTLLLLRLQEEPEHVEPLRRVLGEVVDHPSYKAWLGDEEFAKDGEVMARLFRLDPALTFRGDDSAHDDRRRLLESHRLVQEDVLRVKLHRCGDDVFMTDGLWVPPSLRVYPFSDESDLVIQECQSRGWDLEADFILDPGARAGLNALRCRGESQRIGFDRNPRAVVYAELNAMLAGRPDATFAIHDVRGAAAPPGEDDGDEPSGTPTAAGRRLPRCVPTGTDRLLMLATMPFALAPGPSSIARSADGGRYGAERTIAALQAFRDLAEDLEPGGTARAVVLAYSVGAWGGPGSSKLPRWHIQQRANQIFGDLPDAKVNWRLLRDETLWRVNGRKLERNPMPLDRLSTKANCRYYVRATEDPEEVRRQYDELAGMLNDLGWNYLAYGLVTVEYTVPDRASPPTAALDRLVNA